MSAAGKAELDAAVKEYNSAPRDESVYAKQMHEKRVMDAVRYIHAVANDPTETKATRAYAQSLLDEQVDPKDITRAGIESAGASMAEAGARFSQGSAIAPEQQLSKEELETLAASLTRRVPRAPEIIVADSARLLFGGEVPAGTTPSGGVVGGKMYLFRDGIANVSIATRTVFHELFHSGLDKVMPKAKYIQAMLRLQALDTNVAAYAKRWRESVEGQERKGQMPVQQWNALAVEEALADIAEDLNDGDKLGTARQGIVRNIAKWLADVAEQLGLRSLAQSVRRMTYTETEKFVMDTISASGTPAPGAPAPAPELATARYSTARNPAIPKQISTAQSEIADTIKSFAKKAVTWGAFTRDLAQIASKVLPSAMKFEQLLAERGVIKTAHERAVEKILQAYEALPTSAKGTGPGSVNALLREMTTTNKWGFKPDWLQSVTVDPATERMFSAASPEAQALVKDVLRHGYTTLQQMKRTVLENVESDYDFQLATARAAGDTAYVKELEQQKAKALTEYNSLFQISGETPYAPLKRFGNHVVLAFSQAYLDAEKAGNAAEMRKLQQQGENHYAVMFAETDREAKAIKRRLDAEGKYSLVDKFEKDDNNPLMYAGRDVMGTFYRLRNMVADADPSIDTATSKSVNRLLNDIHLTLLGEQSARQSERNRKNIAGADLDMMRAFATQGRATAHFISSLHNNGKVYDQLREMKKEAGARTPGRGDREMYFNEFAKRFGMSADYQPSPIIDKALGATSVWMLLSNPAYYLQNATQPFMLSLPSIGGKHGYARSAAALTQAYKELLPILKDGKLTEEDYGKLPADVRDAVEKLVDAGRIDISLEQDLGRWRSTEGSKLQKFGNVVEKLRSIAQTVESINRLSTAMAAYRLEVQRGAKPEAAVAYADKIIYDTHGDYSGFNAPRITRTGGWRLITQFKKFQLIQISLLAKLGHQAFQGATPTERMIGRKALAFTLGHAFAMGGVMGLPGFTAISWVLGKIFGDDDEPDNPELTLRRAIGDDALADLLVKGAPKLMGVDLSGKLGMGGMLSILPFTDVDMSKDGYSQALTALMGPFLGGLMPKAADGIGLMGEGEYYQGLEKLLPTGLGNAFKGARLATKGMTQRNGDLVMAPEDISFVDATMTALGLPTNKTTDRQFLQAARYQYDQFFKGQDRLLRKQYTQAYRDGDAAGLQEAREAWAEMQASRQRNGFTVQPLSNLLRAPQEQAKRERETTGGVQTRKQNAGFVQQTRDLLE